MKIALLGILAASAPIALCAQTVYLDFAAASSTTGGVYNDISGASSFVGLTDSTGTSTSLDLSIDFNMANDSTYAQVGAVDIFPATATSDVLWGNAGSSEAAGSNVVFWNLDPAATYDLKIFASRPGTAGRLVLYTATGTNSGASTLDVSAAGTDGLFASITGIQPDGANKISLNVTSAPGSSSSYFYLGAIALSTTAVPEPGALPLLLGLVILGFLTRRRR